jgi:peroxiredoxin
MLALFLARLLLLATFLLAGLGKISSPLRTRRALRQFGVPRRLVGPAATLLPVAELMVALGLAIRGTAHLAAAAALALLVVFTVVVAAALARGRRPECACFGAIRPRLAGARTFIRNGVLAGAGVAVAVFPSGREFPRLGHAPSWLAAVGIALTAALVLVLIILAWRLHLRLQRGEPAGRRRVPVGLAAVSGSAAPRRAELPVGATAPRFDLPALDGGSVSLDSLRAGGRAVLLVFASPGCSQCTAVMSAVAGILDAGRRDLSVAVVASGDREAIRRLAGPGPVPPVACDEKAGAARLFGIAGTPSAVLIGPDGRIASHTVAGASAVTRLLGRLSPAATQRYARSAGRLGGGQDRESADEDQECTQRDRGRSECDTPAGRPTELAAWRERGQPPEVAHGQVGGDLHQLVEEAREEHLP